MKVAVFPVEPDDMGLEAAAAVLEDFVNSKLEELEPRAVIHSVQLVPAQQHYSLPDPDSGYRDFHYVERGFMVVILYTEKEQLK